MSRATVCTAVTRFVSTAALALLTACGGGGGSGDGSSGGGGSGGPPGGNPPPPAITKSDAFRFLNQATYGATDAEAQRLIALGAGDTAYVRWIDEQIAQPASLQLPTVEAAFARLTNPLQMLPTLNADRQEAWFRHSITGPRPAAPARRVRAVGDHGRLAAEQPAEQSRTRSPTTTTCSHAARSAISAS